MMSAPTASKMASQAWVGWQGGDVTGQPGFSELCAFMASIPFFASLDEVTRLRLAGQLEPVHLAAGDVVMAQDDAGDGLFLLLSGRLRVSVAVGGAERVLHDLTRGAIVGEIALLSDRPRSATVRAVRDSDLLLLRVSVFNALVEQTPGLLNQVARLLVDRLLAVDRPQLLTTGSRTIAVAPAGRNAGPAAELAAELTDRLAGAGSAFRLDQSVIGQHLGAGAAQREPGDQGRNELTGWLHAVERGNDHVVYQTDAEDTAWSRLCLSQADVVLLTGDATGDSRLGAVESRALAIPSLRCELVLVHPAGPAATARWLERRPVADFHHLRGGYPEDAARLARMVTGTACGVVLGGGGPRGFAHLGALRALEEAGVPIDVVGGTSIGAVMGALCAQGLSDQQRVERAITAFTRSGRLIRFTFPLVALSSGRRVDRLLSEHLGSAHIEDLPRRFFCVSANLTRAEEVVHERGVLWQAVRASLSLPGIFPPVYADGDLLVDGATLDNVPVEVMRARIGSGPVIAVDLTPEVEPVTAAPFDPGLSGWRVLGRRLNPLVPARPMPSVIDILSRSTGLSGVRHRRAALASNRVDLMLRPPLPAIGALDFKAGAALIEAGYRYAVEALERSPLISRFTR
jgi:predicted acylesterase/phospholipase RssA/CRP-like cAMP-binding protein